MELRQLRYFVKIVELGSMSRAASVLYIAQPALSQQVTGLERDLGQLLIRNARGVAPTAAGRTLYQRAVRILRDVQTA